MCGGLIAKLEATCAVRNVERLAEGVVVTDQLELQRTSTFGIGERSVRGTHHDDWIVWIELETKHKVCQAPMRAVIRARNGMCDSAALPPLRLCVFDFDDTLVRSESTKHELFFTIAAEVDGDTGRALMQTSMSPGGNRYTFFRNFAEARMPGGDPNAVQSEATRLSAEYTRRIEDLIAKADEVPGAHECCTWLRRRGVHLWINSATPHSDLLSVVRRRGWADLFDGVLGGGVGGGSRSCL